MPDDARDLPAPAMDFAGRRPSQKRSQARVEALLDAADQLLQQHELHEISLHDIANLAGVPPSSAYHFFPTREAAFLRLAERYLRKLHAALEAPIDPSLIERWPDYIRIRNEATVRFFNESASARKLTLGSAVGSAVRNLDYEDIESIAANSYEAMNAFFVMPYMNEPEVKFRVLIGIYDGVWASSYSKYGYITPVFAKEALAAGIAYLGTLLPPTIPLRRPPPETDG